MRRITIYGGSLVMKICYPARLKTKDSPEYLVKKSFSFSKCGGFEGALKAARKLRNQYEKKYNLKTDLWNPVTGVCLHRRARLYGFHYTWRATWREEIGGERVNKQKDFTFKNGDKRSSQEAYKKAVKHRRMMEKLHY